MENITQIDRERERERERESNNCMGAQKKNTFKEVLLQLKENDTQSCFAFIYEEKF